MASPLIGRQIDWRGSRTMVVLNMVIFGAACVYMGGVVRGPLTLGLASLFMPQPGRDSDMAAA